MAEVVTLTIGDDPQEPRDTARLMVSVRPASGSGTFPEIELTGSRDGLVWLAKRLLEVAQSDREMHTHLDNEASGPIYRSPDGWWITIARAERL